MLLISPSPLDFGRLSKTYSEIGSACLQTPQRLVVNGDWGWFAIEEDAFIPDELSVAEAKRIAQVVPEPVYTGLDYKNSVAADLAIGLMPLSDEIYIGTDHGLFCPINEVKKRIRTGLDWQSSST